MVSSDSGIGLEGGVYVTAIAAGSPAAREGSLNIGDRLIAVSLLIACLTKMTHVC